MGFGMSTPEGTLPTGNPAPQICPTCLREKPCKHWKRVVVAHMPGAAAFAFEPINGAEAGALVQSQQLPVAMVASQSTEQTANSSSDSSGVAPYEHENIGELRRQLQVPQLIDNTVAFCQSLLDCYRITGADETAFSEKFAALKKRAEYLSARHACIEQNKGKGVLVPNFVNAHLKQVEEWVADCETFSQSFYTEPLP